jgi:hypothetical protein
VGLYYNPIPPHIGAQQPLDSKKLTPPQSGPDNPPFLGTRIAQAIFVAWTIASIAPVPVVAKNSTPPGGPATPPLFKKLDYGIYAAWMPAPHIPQPNFVPDDFAPWATAFGASYVPVGSRIPTAVQVAWLPQLLVPVVAPTLDPPISGPAPQDPPRIGARVPVEVQIAWLPPQPMPVVGFSKLSTSGPAAVYVPIGTRVPSAVQAWINPGWSLQPSMEFYTPSGPDRAPLQGLGLPSALQAWWMPGWAPPQRQSFLVPAAVFFPFRGGQVPREVLRSWDVQPYTIQVRTFRTASGPLPSQPPIGGGARIRNEVLVGWIPPPPLPILGSVGAVIGASGYVFLPAWRVAVVPAINKVAVVPKANKVAVVPAIRKADEPPRGT